VKCIANATIETKEHGTEIEITPEMIDAGCAELSLCESSDPPWSTVRSVYLAMELTRRHLPPEQAHEPE
jgi:hypothetical protein